MKIEKEVIKEWKRYMESPEYNHNPECGTLMIAQHFAEWGREHPTPPTNEDGC